MISPYVRRHRLITELRSLRTEAGMTIGQLATKIGRTRQQLSRLENGGDPNLNDVMQILEVLEVGGSRWTQVVDAAREAAERGWWAPDAREMGERQALFADLEAGATTIREYQQTIIPGLLQTPDYTRSRIAASTVPPTPGVTLDDVLRGRSGRQKMMNRPDGPRYEVILEELAVRRHSAPPDVLRGQLQHLADRAENDKITIRVLPTDARIPGYKVPLCSFSAYTYADPGDPVVIGIENVTSDVVLTDPDQVERHVKLHDSLCQVALSVEDSHDYLTKAAQALPRDE